MQSQLSTVKREQSIEAEYYHGDSMAPRKNRQNDRQAICFLYASSVVATSLSIAVASMHYAGEHSQRSVTAEWGRPLFVISLYVTSCIILLTMAGYFEYHRSESFEAVHRGRVSVPFSVKFSVRGEKVNLYLRLGLAMFGIMTVGHAAVKFAEDKHIGRTDVCSYLRSVLEMLFFVLQTLFILRYHRLVILQYNEVMGAGLVHLLTTNLCIWADISVGKIDKTLSYGSHWKTKSGVSVNISALSTMGAVPRHKYNKENQVDLIDLLDLSFYLLPTVSEYCLLAAALLYEITVRIGQPRFIEIEKSSDRKKTRSTYRNCLDGCKITGSWFGILTVLIVVALTIMTGATPKYVDHTQNYWKAVIILVEEAILCLFGIGFVISAFLQTRKLKFSIATRQSHLEEFLLYTAFFFSANYTISTIILAADIEEADRNTQHSLDRKRYLLICRCTLNALELIQILLQTYMIQDSFHRCSDKIKHQVMKPGRQSIVALLGINLAFWIQQSFQLKNADILFLIESNRGSYGWILLVVTMPISLFYRYHCTVCLSQCFNKLYEDETRRFEEMWRYQVDPLTDTIIPAMGSMSIYEQNDSMQQAPVELTTPKASPMSNSHKARMLTLVKTKPWRTIDIAENTQRNKGTTLQFDGQEDFHYSSKDTVNMGADSKDKLVSVECLPLEMLPEEKEIGTGPKVTPDGKEGNGESKFPQPEPHQRIKNISDVVWHSRALVQPKNVRKSQETLANIAPTISITTKTDENNYASGSRSKPVHALGRRQAKSLTLSTSPLLDLDNSPFHNKSDRTSKSPNHSKSPRPSLTRHPLVGQQIRRRRTLRNLETAKYRVLAAELAHRMVIERGTNPTASGPSPQDSSCDHCNDGSTRHLNEDRNSKTITSLTDICRKNSSAASDNAKEDFRVAQAMSETAAITIAPVESRLLSTLHSPDFLKPADTFSRKISGKSKGRRSIFLSPNRLLASGSEAHSPHEKRASHSAAQSDFQDSLLIVGDRNSTKYDQSRSNSSSTRSRNKRRSIFHVKKVEMPRKFSKGDESES